MRWEGDSLWRVIYFLLRKKWFELTTASDEEGEGSLGAVSNGRWLTSPPAMPRTWCPKASRCMYDSSALHLQGHLGQCPHRADCHPLYLSDRVSPPPDYTNFRLLLAHIPPTACIRNDDLCLINYGSHVCSAPPLSRILCLLITASWALVAAVSVAQPHLIFKYIYDWWLIIVY